MTSTEHTITAKTWKAGKDTIVITIPKLIRETEEIEEGTIIEATIKKKKNKKSQFSIRE